MSDDRRRIAALESAAGESAPCQTCGRGLPPRDPFVVLHEGDPEPQPCPACGERPNVIQIVFVKAATIGGQRL
jgi:hypothetical protein